MRLLLVKTSSLGDVIHNLPIVSDIRRRYPAAHIDWCVEEGFADIVRLHPGVNGVLTVALRRWRKAIFSGATWRDIAAARARLQAAPYDLVLDTQGLLKSALIARQARGPHAGYAPDSAREPLAARFYERHYRVSRTGHAVLRNRQLAAAALDLPDDAPLDYGISSPEAARQAPAAHAATRPYLVLLTATSRDDKLWPAADWIALGQALAARGYGAVLPGGSAPELARAARIAAAIPGALALPPSRLPALAGWLDEACAVVGVDTGLTHLAAALGRPTVALYTATEPGLTGVLGSGFYCNLGGTGLSPAPAEVLASLAGVLD